MSKQESSYFEADQPMDQSQNQLPAASEKDAEIAPPEISADGAQKDMQPESQASNLTAEAVAEDTSPPVLPLPRQSPIPASARWRFPLQRQHELRYILLTVLVVAILTAIVFTACMGYLGLKRPTETYFFAERAQQKIVINNDQGSITIHSQRYGPFGFRVERYSRGFGPGLLGMDVLYTQYAATTTLTTHVPPDILFSGSRGINIDVTVPASDAIQVHTGVGSIVLNDLTGNVVASTDKGALVVENCQGQMSLDSKIGPVSVSHFSGQLAMTVHQGNIKADDVHLSDQSSAQADSGAIIFSGALDRDGKYHFSTDTGPISLTLPETTAFQLAFNHTSSVVVNEFGQLEHGTQPQAMITVQSEYGTLALHKLRAK